MRNYKARLAPIGVAVVVLSGSVALCAQQGSKEVDDRAAGAVRGMHVPPTVAGHDAIARAIRAGAWDRAEALLIPEAERSPRDAQLLVLIGRVFFLDRKPLNAAIALKKADAVRPLDADERLLLALSYVAVHQGEWARAEFERLAGADPANVTYTYWLGRLDYDKGQYEAATVRFRAVTSRQPDHVRAWDNLALCYEALNRMDEAAGAYEMAVKANREAAPPSPWPPVNYAVLLRRQGDLPRAEALLRDAVRFDESFARAHYELGVVLEQKGDTAGAVAYLQRAIGADASYAEPYYALSRIYRRTGDLVDADAALASFERLKDRRPSAQP